MNIIFIGNKRKDGKYKIKTIFKGAPNMFGGVDAGHTYTHLYNEGAARDLLKSPALKLVTNRPHELGE